MQNFNILIAPLDWGLGHTTRIIPIIKTLQNKNYDVTIAVCAKQKVVLEAECTNVYYVDLFGYNITYASNKLLFVLKIILQIPKIIFCIYKEHKWLKNYVNNNKVDLIISDNRYGFFHRKIKSVFITHQLLIKTGNRFTENLLQRINYGYINKFKECWIPDIAGEINIAGELSHPKTLPKNPIKYIGILNRFEKVDTEIIYDICVLLSGPEPQRTLLEEKLLSQLSSIKNNKILFVRGLPTSKEQIAKGNIILKNHLQGKELQKAICSSKLVIARSGYTSVMELVALQKPLILIPTPMQTEQEYLAEYLQEKNICIACSQANLDIATAIEKASAKKFQVIIIENLLDKIL